MLEVITFFSFHLSTFFFFSFYSFIEIFLQAEIFLIIHTIILHELFFKEVKSIPFYFKKIDQNNNTMSNSIQI